MSRKDCGYTLIEILVVLGIISILMALLLPMLGRVREQGRKTRCLSNLHQLSLGVFLYAQDYEDHYPLGCDPSDQIPGSWDTIQNGKYAKAVSNLKILPTVMAGYVREKTLWECPSDNGCPLGGPYESLPLGANSSCYGTFGMSYLYTTLAALDQETISGVRAWSYQPPHSERDPVDIPLLFDHVGHWHGGTERSEERLNYVMIDGHAINVDRVRADHLNSITFSLPNPSR